MIKITYVKIFLNRKKWCEMKINERKESDWMRERNTYDVWHIAIDNYVIIHTRIRNVGAMLILDLIY